MVSNVHNLIHLADSCRLYGCLDAFSAFPFENHMQFIEKRLRGYKKPLQQLSNRLQELNDLFSCNKVNESGIIFQTPLPFDTSSTFNCDQYKSVTIKTINYSVLEKDSYFISKEFACFKICSIFKNNDDIVFSCKKFTILKAFYKYPLNSKDLHIYKASHLLTTKYTLSYSKV